MLLPSSHVLIDDTLTIDEHPFASSFSDAYKGRYNDLEVCVKRLRVSSASDLDRTAKGDICGYYCQVCIVF